MRNVAFTSRQHERGLSGGELLMATYPAVSFKTAFGSLTGARGAAIEHAVHADYAPRATFKQWIGQRALHPCGRGSLVQHRDGVIHSIAGRFPNCFSCHNTQAVPEKGIPIDRDRQDTLLIEPKQINVSHVFSQFVLDEVNASL